MPTWDSSKPEKFQAYVSAYSVDSFLSSWADVGNIGGWMNASMIAANATT